MRRRWVAILVPLLAAGGLAACGDSDRGSSDAPPPASDAAPSSDGGAISEFGTLPFPCGPNDGGGELPDDPSATLGVTDEGINLAVFNDVGYQSAPGIGQEFLDAATVFAAECNAAGGINGRPVVIHGRDAKLFEYPPRVQEACAEDFAVVGGGAVLDDGGAQALTDCGLPSIPATAVTAAASLADNVVQPLPNPPNVKPAAQFVKLVDELERDGAGTGLESAEVMQHAGILYGDIQTTIDGADQVRKTLAPLGFEFVYDATYNVIGEANWAPFAQAIADAGVEFFTFVGDGAYLAQLQAAMDQIESAPAIMMLESNFYDPEYGGEVAGLTPETLVLVRSPFWPLERAAENPATQTFVDLYDAHLSRAEPSPSGMQSMSAFLLFAQSAATCDRANDLTRQCVFDTAKEVREWTAGGLHTASNPSESLPPSCALLIEVADGAFDVWRPDGDTPDDTYFCPDDNAIIEIEGDYGEGVVRGGG